MAQAAAQVQSQPPTSPDVFHDGRIQDFHSQD
jgi:hypothetical protein